MLIPVFLSPLIHDIQLWALFTQFGDNDIAKQINIPECCKINKKTEFYLLKMKMVGSIEVCIVAWSRYITLKLF